MALYIPRNIFHLAQLCMSSRKLLDPTHLYQLLHVVGVKLTQKFLSNTIMFLLLFLLERSTHIL
jgi:hypothetical protein